MALNDIEKKRCEKLMDAYMQHRRPPPHVRDQLDMAYRITNQSIEIFLIRPLWDNPDEKIEEPVAKTTFVRAQGTWKVFWQRADLKWHSYEPHAIAQSLEEFLDVIEQDAHGCFYG